MKQRFILFVLSIVVLFTVTGCFNNVKIVKSESKKIQYEKFDNGLVSMQIPKGWKVDIPTTGYSNYTFKLYNPKNKNYTFLFDLKLQGFLKSEGARKKFAALYPSSAFGKLAAIDPQSTEAFFKVWNTNAKLSNTEELKYEYFPYLNDFTVIENLGKVNIGGDILRATFKNSNGELEQGIFTTTIYSAGSYYMYGYDMAPLTAYHTIMMMAPDDEFNNWQSIYDYILGSVTFSSEFMKGLQKEESTMVSTVQANQKIYDEMSDMIMDSWNKRSNSYDIISQKQSDATLGYERVYDVETNEVYRAYNGFTDSYSGYRYKPVTDDMYTSVVSGYIEK